MSIAMDWAALAGLAVLASAVAWLVRLQMRQQGQEMLSNERHTENLNRLDRIEEHITHVDAKLDRLIARLR